MDRFWIVHWQAETVYWGGKAGIERSTRRVLGDTRVFNLGHAIFWETQEPIRARKEDELQWFWVLKSEDSADGGPKSLRNSSGALISCLQEVGMCKFLLCVLSPFLYSSLQQFSVPPLSKQALD